MLQALEVGGAPGRIRTHDPLVRSQVLYPTELRALEGAYYIRGESILVAFGLL